MRHSFLIDIDPEEVFGSDIQKEKIKKWFSKHEEEFILNLYEHASNELKYFGSVLYPIEDE